jgi:hypothetical protein
MLGGSMFPCSTKGPGMCTGTCNATCVSGPPVIDSAMVCSSSSGHIRSAPFVYTWIPPTPPVPAAVCPGSAGDSSTAWCGAASRARGPRHSSRLLPRRHPAGVRQWGQHPAAVGPRVRPLPGHLPRPPMARVGSSGLPPWRLLCQRGAGPHGTAMGHGAPLGAAGVCG